MEKAAAYLGLDSPDYWLDVVESRTAASAQNVEALLKKFIAKIESMT